MLTKAIQIESIDALTLLEKLDSLASDIKSIHANFQPKEPPQYLSRQQVADMFGISLVTVGEWTQKGILTAYRLGNRVYFKRHEIEAALVNIKGKGGRHE